MSKKKIIFSFVIISFWIVSCGAINFVNASSVVEVCRLNAKIINVTEGYVFIDITDIKIYNKNSTLCADINKNSDYKITRNNFLKNSYRESVFVGQNIIIDGVSGNAMGPDGPVYWDSWELESAGGKAIKLPIALEKANESVTSGDTDFLIEDDTYTVAELNKNTSATPKKFFTEAYVINTTLTAYPPNSSSNFIINKMVISDDKSYEVTYPLCKIGSPCPPVLTNKQTELVVADRKYNRDLFQLKKKYRFEVSIRNIGISNIPKNEFALISVKNIDGSAIASETTTLPITDQPTKKSFLGRIWDWFAELFKR